jgi:hypothetical protein
MNPVKFLSMAMIVILVINLIFLAIGWIDTLWFFVVLIVIGVIAFKGLPYIRKR